MVATYGWRARVGTLNPVIVAHTIAYEFYKVVPPGIMLLIRNLAVKDARNPKDLETSKGLLEEGVKDLKQAGADLISGMGIPLLLSEGVDGHKKILKLLTDLSGLPAITSLQSAVEAFRRLEVYRLAIATIYGKPEYGEKLADFMRAQGFEVVGLSTIDTGFTGIDKHKLDSGFVYRYGKKVFREAGRAQALYLPAGSWPTVEYIEHLERDIAAPVVSSNLAFIWNSLRVLDIHEPVRGYGRLLSTL